MLTRKECIERIVHEETIIAVRDNCYGFILLSIEDKTKIIEDLFNGDSLEFLQCYIEYTYDK